MASANLLAASSRYSRFFSAFSQFSGDFFNAIYRSSSCACDGCVCVGIVSELYSCLYCFGVKAGMKQGVDRDL